MNDVDRGAPPRVDVTIAVHTASRPIARAVQSVIAGTRAPVRVNVIAHNIDPAVIAANLGTLVSDPRVRLLAYDDGIHSPAGPMNFGFAQSDAEFVSVMGSDDELAPGAIDSWLKLHDETRASVVIPQIRIDGRGTDPYPPVRWGRRRRNLDPVRDRLAYRSAPVGLIHRERFSGLRFTEGLASGEDLAYSTTLWFTGGRLAYDRTGPAYLIRDDADDRVTFAPRAVASDFAFLDAIESAPWFAGLGQHERVALVVKLIRVHFFDAVRARLGAESHVAEVVDPLADVIARLAAMAPAAMRVLSKADRAVIQLIASRAPHPDQLRSAVRARWNYRSVAALVPRNPLWVMHAQAPVRTLLAGVRATTRAGDAAD